MSKNVRYRESFHFVDTEEQAAAFCAKADAENSPYVRKHHPADYTPWESRDKAGNVLEKKFICWYPVAKYY